MIQTVNFNDFQNAFIAHGRENQFSYEALQIIFDYCEEWEDGKWELDVIELCCDFDEDSWGNVAKSYNIELDVNDSDEDKIQQIKEFLESETIMVGYVGDSSLSDTVIYSQF